ncbi:hypothetical protein [Microbacterium sp. KNMS]
MRPYGKAGLMGLLYSILAVVAFVADRDVWGWVLFLAGALMLGVSYICEAIEKAGKS